MLWNDLLPSDVEKTDIVSCASELTLKYTVGGALSQGAVPYPQQRRPSNACKASIMAGWDPVASFGSGHIWSKGGKFTENFVRFQHNGIQWWAAPYYQKFSATSLGYRTESTAFIVFVNSLFWQPTRVGFHQFQHPTCTGGWGGGWEGIQWGPKSKLCLPFWHLSLTRVTFLMMKSITGPVITACVEGVTANNAGIHLESYPMRTVDRFDEALLFS